MASIPGLALPQLPRDAAGVDWSLLAETGRGNKLLCFAAEGFARLGVGRPAAFDEAAARYRRDVMARNAFNMASIGGIAAILENAGVRFVFFKGPVYQHLLYGHYFLRPASDVDVLIAQRDFPAASDALQAGGYYLPTECDRLWWRHFLGEQHFFSRDNSRATVDLHHRIQQPGCPQPRRTEACLEEPLMLRVGDAALPYISRINGALLAAISFVKAMTHHECSAQYLADFCTLALHLDPAGRRELTARARDQGLLNTLRFTLSCARRMFDLPQLEGLPSASASLPIAGRDLLLAIFAAREPSILWPRLRHTLWDLCDEGVMGRKAGTYVAVSMNLVASKLARNWRPRAA
ncbi:MAG: nucleotidyltransferase family protein [Sphingobium sp.]